MAGYKHLQQHHAPTALDDVDPAPMLSDASASSYCLCKYGYCLGMWSLMARQTLTGMGFPPCGHEPRGLEVVMGLGLRVCYGISR